MGALQSIFRKLTCNCSKSNDGTTTVTVSIKGTSCCNKKKIIINMGDMDVNQVDGILQRINSEKHKPISSEVQRT